MKKHKSLLAVLLTAVVAASSLAGCGPKIQVQYTPSAAAGGGEAAAAAPAAAAVPAARAVRAVPAAARPQNDHPHSSIFTQHSAGPGAVSHRAPRPACRETRHAAKEGFGFAHGGLCPPLFKFAERQI